MKNRYICYFLIHDLTFQLLCSWRYSYLFFFQFVPSCETSEMPQDTITLLSRIVSIIIDFEFQAKIEVYICISVYNYLYLPTLSRNATFCVCRFDRFETQCRENFRNAMFQCIYFKGQHFGHGVSDFRYLRKSFKFLLQCHLCSS